MIERVRSIALMITLSATAAPAAAQDLSAMKGSELIDMCASVEDQKISAITQQLLSCPVLILDEEYAARGAECLSEHLGEEYVYAARRSKFITRPEYDSMMSGVEAANTQRQVDNEVRSMKSQRQTEFVQRLADACYDELDEDEFRALTTPACHDVFMTLGLERP